MWPTLGAGWLTILGFMERASLLKTTLLRSAEFLYSVGLIFCFLPHCRKQLQSNQALPRNAAASKLQGVKLLSYEFLLCCTEITNEQITAAAIEKKKKRKKIKSMAQTLKEEGNSFHQQVRQPEH